MDRMHPEMFPERPVFVQGDPLISAGGGVNYGHLMTDPGAEVKASVENLHVMSVDRDGVPRSAEIYVFSLYDDPREFAGADGVQSDDAFRWRGKLYQAMGPDFRVGSFWQVRCVLAE